MILEPGSQEFIRIVFQLRKHSDGKYVNSDISAWLVYSYYLWASSLKKGSVDDSI